MLVHVWCYFLQHKLRFLLCAISMSVAICSMLVLSYLSTILQNQMILQMEEMGANLIYVSLPNTLYLPQNWQKELQECANLYSFSRVASIQEENQIVQAVDASYFEIQDSKIEQGRLFKEFEKQVAVIGASLDTEKLHKTIRIQQQTYEVIGKLTKRGETLMGNEDQCIFIPYQLQNKNAPLLLQVKSKTKDTVESVKHYLIHYFQLYYKNDEFQVVSQAQMLEVMNQLLNFLKQILLAIAFLSFVVSLVGIMNVMFIGMEQRKAEIGIKKALGATQGEILGQFVLEVLWISVMGVAFGGWTGGLIILLLSQVFSTSFQISLGFLLKISVICISMGVLTGVIPAYFASRKEVVDCLRM